MTKGDKAKELFLEGYTCCQAVVAAFADEPWFVDSGLTLETACKLSSSFGGGMGRLREVCGAVSGMFMISGLAQGFAEKKISGKSRTLPKNSRFSCRLQKRKRKHHL